MLGTMQLMNCGRLQAAGGELNTDHNLHHAVILLCQGREVVLLNRDPKQRACELVTEGNQGRKMGYPWQLPNE